MTYLPYAPHVSDGAAMGLGGSSAQLLNSPQTTHRIQLFSFRVHLGLSKRADLMHCLPRVMEEGGGSTHLAGWGAENGASMEQLTFRYNMPTLSVVIAR